MITTLVLSLWATAAVTLCWANHRLRRARPTVHRYPPAVPEYVRRVDWLPPVPVPLSQLPVCLLTEAEVDARFHALVDELERRAS